MGKEHPIASLPIFVISPFAPCALNRPSAHLASDHSFRACLPHPPDAVMPVIKLLPSSLTLATVAQYALYANLLRFYLLRGSGRFEADTPPPSAATKALYDDILYNPLYGILFALTNAKALHGTPIHSAHLHLPALITAKHELLLVSIVATLFLLPTLKDTALTLASTHFPSIAPPYVSTVLGSFELSHDGCLSADGAPREVQEARGRAFQGLLDKLERLFPNSAEVYARIDGRFSDIRFFDVKKVFFPFRSMARRLPVCVVSTSTEVRGFCDNPRLNHIPPPFILIIISYTHTQPP